MTREEEIQKLIDEETGVDNYGSLDYQIGVCDGVRLADETMIEKACEWLSKALDNFYIGTQQANFTDKVKFIESFKKAMRNNYGRFCAF